MDVAFVKKSVLHQRISTYLHTYTFTQIHTYAYQHAECFDVIRQAEIPTYTEK